MVMSTQFSDNEPGFPQGYNLWTSGVNWKCLDTIQAWSTLVKTGQRLGQRGQPQSNISGFGRAREVSRTQWRKDATTQSNMNRLQVIDRGSWLEEYTSGISQDWHRVGSYWFKL